MARKTNTPDVSTEAAPADTDPGAVALKFNIDATEPKIIQDDQGNEVKTPQRFFPGVPCRDLTADEVGALAVHVRRGLIESGIYTVA